MSYNINQDPVYRDHFKVKKGLHVVGDTIITGNLTLSGGLSTAALNALTVTVTGNSDDIDDVTTTVSSNSAAWGAGGLSLIHI